MISRLLADADLNHAIISGVVHRNAGIDFKRAEEVPLEGLADEVVLLAAAQEHRVLVSHDVSTMPGHLRNFASTSASLLAVVDIPYAGVTFVRNAARSGKEGDETQRYFRL